MPLVLGGATSGSTTLTPVDAVTATITLPSATGTLATLVSPSFTGTVGVAAITATGLISGSAGLSMTGSASNISLGSNYINDSGATTDRGISFVSGGAINVDAYSNGYVLNLYQNTAAANPLGLKMYSASDPNGADAGGLDTAFSGSRRFAFDTNGGLRNYSANNVNLSDMRTKDVFEDYTPEMLAELEAKFIAIRRGRFKYNDQTHGDWNYGKSAQSVAEQLPGLAGVWDENAPKEEQLLCEYSHDITQIGEALLVRALKRITELEARVAALEAK